MTESNDSALHSGFLSEADKRKFTTIAGILGAVFFLIQVIGPFIAAFAMMPIMMFRSGFQDYSVEEAALHQGEIYVVETSRSFDWEGSQGKESRLMRIRDGELEEVFDLLEWEPALLSDGERLWLVSQDRVSALVDGRLEPYPSSETLGDIGRPFLFQGAPAVIESRPDATRLLGWRGADWTELREVPELAAGCCSRALAVDDSVWLFRNHERTLYVQNLNADDPTWRIVMSEPSRWSVLLVDERPTVVSASPDDGFLFVEYDGTGWGILTTEARPRTSFREVSAFQERPGSPVFVLSQGFPGSLTVRMWNGRELADVEQFGGSFPFPAPIMLFMTLPHLATVVLSLLLAVILSSMMHRHRVTEHRHSGTSVPYASLTRRAVSQMVDALVLGSPFLFVWYRAFNNFEEFVGTPGLPLKLFAFIGIMFAWMLAGFVAFSVGEGLWGLTPGKWLLGIRVVGTDLERCGIGRAIIRNLLKFVDGFFNYLVGILLVAFTPEWQRVGDLAARTIVVRSEPRAE